MTPETVKIAITQADDSMAIMSFVILGRGDMLPFGAEWADKAEAIWMREPTPANLEHEIGRTAGLSRPIKGYRKIDDIEVPADRTYRNALRDRGDKLDWDMPAARELHREKLRHARASAFVRLDGEWMKAQGQGKTAEADAVEAKRQMLRDLPDDPKIEDATTIQELKAVWNDELSPLD